MCHGVVVIVIGLVVLTAESTYRIFSPSPPYLQYTSSSDDTAWSARNVGIDYKIVLPSMK
jgi:hypothetical protein